MNKFVLIPSKKFMSKNSSYYQKALDKVDQAGFGFKKSTNFLETCERQNKVFRNELFMIGISPRIKLSLADSILLDGRQTNFAIVGFLYALKRKNLECL